MFRNGIDSVVESVGKVHPILSLNQPTGSKEIELRISKKFDALKNQFIKEQLNLKSLLILDNFNLNFEVIKGNGGKVNFKRLKRVAGVDLSFFKQDPSLAVATVAILDFVSLKVLHLESKLVPLTLPYVPGFLAFREIPAIVELLNLIETNHSHLKPDVIMVDGNGVLHPNQFGLASHLGVVTQYPTVGVAKKYLNVKDGDLLNNYKTKFNCNLVKDVIPLIGDSGYIYGNTLIGAKNSTNPIFVSAGHRIDLETATALVRHCCKYRIPEPIRIADLSSRQSVREIQEKATSLV